MNFFITMNIIFFNESAKDLLKNLNNSNLKINAEQLFKPTRTRESTFINLLTVTIFVYDTRL